MKGSKMSKVTDAPKSVKTATYSVDANVENLYSVLIEAGITAIAEGFNFIESLDVALKSGTTQEDAKGTMKEMASNIGVTPLVTYSQVPQVPTTAEIIRKNYADMDKFTPKQLLTIGGNVLADVKAKGVKAHLAKFDSIKALKEGTKTKAESQADAKAANQKEEIAELSPAITTESLLENFVEFFKGKNLGDLETAELEMAKRAAAIVIAIIKNTEAKAKKTA
jgi:hypothetical protein